MKNPLFKETVTVTELKGPRGNEILGDVTGQDALRILHRDKPIKVVITEEFYLSMLALWQSGGSAGSAEESAHIGVNDMKRIAREEFQSLMAKMAHDPMKATKPKRRHG